MKQLDLVLNFLFSPVDDFIKLVIDSLHLAALGLIAQSLGNPPFSIIVQDIKLHYFVIDFPPECFSHVL